MVSTRSRRLGSDGYPLLGDQRPRILWEPPGFSSTAGKEAIDLADAAGLHLDDWQQFALNGMLLEDTTGHWVCFECGMVVPRQNGKGAILEARELAGLILFGEELIVHTAHEFKTAQEHFRRMRNLFDSWDDLRKRVKKITEAHGEEGIELTTGQRLRFAARSKRSGRGFTGDTLVYDEAMILDPDHVEASMPLVSARPNPQILYMGSAGDEASVVFGRVRTRGLRGGDPALWFGEWSADEERLAALEKPEERAAFLADPREWARSNPGGGIRIPFSHIAKEHRSMTEAGFLRERLCIGRWPDPTAGTAPISEEAWLDRSDEEMRGDPDAALAFAIDMPPDRSSTSIGVARWAPDDQILVEVIARRQGTAWVLPWIEERIERWEPVAVAIGAGTPAATFISDWQTDDDLDDDLLMVVPQADQAAACGAFYDAVVGDDPNLVHRNQAILNAALKDSVKKKASDAWKFDRGGLGDISALWAVVLAMWALESEGNDYDLLDSIGQVDDEEGEA